MCPEFLRSRTRERVISHDIRTELHRTRSNDTPGAHMDVRSSDGRTSPHACPDNELHEQAHGLLTMALPPYMVYRSILIATKAGLLEVAHLVNTDAFAASKLFTPWKDFHALVLERLQLLEAVDAAPGLVYKGCDNLTCGQILTKSELRRCSSCLDLYYCSKQCQKLDCRAGHRVECRKFYGLRRLPEEQQCNMQDRAFLRALIRRDYIANRGKLLIQQITLLKRDPQQLHYVVFDYMKGPVSVDVWPWPRDESEMIELPWDLISRHHNHGCRAASSAGLVELHLMVIPNVLKMHWKIVPLRHGNADIPKDCGISCRRLPISRLRTHFLSRESRRSFDRCWIWFRISFMSS
ncbi:hypothetical protein C8R43DRAFT_208097 [Mycena crocata]|nr:hypothetical protein C8R43DRAFT_208097 [Mycena crocata]